MSLRADSRYSPGGDIYEQIAREVGYEIANRVYSASLSNDDLTLQRALNDYAQARRGKALARPGSDSTWENFSDQITSDPLAAPLDALNNQLGLAVWNVLRNPFVLGAAILVAYFWLWPKVKKLF